MIHACTFSLALLAIASPLTPARTVSLESPLDQQVFQRDAHDMAEVKLVGTVPKDAGWVEARATLADGLRGRAVDWQVIAHGSQLNGRFAGSLRLAAGGWYAVNVRCRRSAADQEILGETVIGRVGVGDVFVVAGQSNAANGGEERQAPKTGMVVNFTGTQWQLANDPQPGADCEGGSFIPAFGRRLGGTIWFSNRCRHLRYWWNQCQGMVAGARDLSLRAHHQNPCAAASRRHLGEQW